MNKRQPVKQPSPATWTKQIKLTERYLESVYKPADKDWQNTVRIIRLDGFVSGMRIG
ncbi:hypothetical protein MUP95_10465 [bacterium]|nr:hypothetical protein [bacterium]